MFINLNLLFFMEFIEKSKISAKYTEETTSYANYIEKIYESCYFLVVIIIKYI